MLKDIAQGHLRAMSVIQVAQHRRFLNDKKNESADNLKCSMLQENTFIDYKREAYVRTVFLVMNL